MNIPEMAKRVLEINEEHGIDNDPFPKFDQEPAPADEAVASAETEAPEAPADTEETPAEQEDPAEQTDEEAGVDSAAATVDTPAPDDDIAWVKANKGFEVADPVVAKTLRNQEEMIRRQGTEVGEARKLRQEFEAFQAQMAQRLEQQFEPDEEWEEWADESLAISPPQALVEAYNSGGQQALNYVVSRWHALDPAAATAFQIEMARTEPTAPAAPQIDQDDVWGKVGSRHPDLFDYKQSMEALLDDRETLDRMNALASQNPEAALESLYLLARVGQTDKQRSEALAKANAARAAKEDAAARDATVASATASAGHGEGRPLTEAEQVRANIRAELGLVIPE